ncbi:MAG: aldo/keto reductase [Novosphingobium sp.]
MLYPRLGQSGLKISQLILGTVTFGELVGEKHVEEVVKTAIDQGISTFDTADAYGQGESERLLGRALKGERHRVVICTKVGLRVEDSEADHAGSFGAGYDHAARWRRGISPNETGLSRAHIVPAVDASLKRLGTDWIDLYQVHRWDNEVPIEETLGVLDDLVRAGKVRYIGCSQYAAAQLHEAAQTSRDLRLTRFASMQQAYNMANRASEAEVLPAAQETGIGILAFQVLAGGILTGRYRPDREPEEGSRVASRKTLQNRYWNNETFKLVDRLEELGRRFERRPEELAIGWVLAKPAVNAVIIGADKPEDLIRNTALARRPLSEEESAAVAALTA